MNGLEDSIAQARALLSRDIARTREARASESNDRSQSEFSSSHSKDDLVKSALTSLQEIHRDALTAEANSTAEVNKVLEKAENKTVIFSLCEIIAVLCIQSNLSPKNLLPYRNRSKLLICRDGVDDQPSDEPYTTRIQHLAPVTSGLCEIFKSSGKGISGLIRNRILLDTICSAAEIARFGSDNPRAVLPSLVPIRVEFQRLLQHAVDKTPMQWLLPNLTALLKSSPAQWFRSTIAELIAVIPLRRYGVRHVIDFMAAVHAGPQVVAEDGQPTTSLNAPQISSEVISRLCVTFSSVPSTSDAETWFQTVLMQLFELLDAPHESGLPTIAGKVIATGILSKRSTGAPGTPAWTYISANLLDKIDPPSAYSAKSKSKRGFTTLVAQKDLETAVKQLLVICEQTLTPGVVHRLLKARLLPVWGLYNYSRKRNDQSQVTIDCWKLLLLYVKVCQPRPQEMSNWSQELLLSGGKHYEYAPGSAGGVEIRSRVDGQQDPVGMIELIEGVETRANDFVTLLLSTNSKNDEVVGEVFEMLLEEALSPAKAETSSNTLLSELEDPDPILAIVNVSLVRILLEQHRGRLGKGEAQLFRLITRIVNNYLDGRLKVKDQRQRMGHVSLGSLGNIIQAGSAGDGPDVRQEDEESTAMALSLLHTTVNGMDKAQLQDNMTFVKAILPLLTQLLDPSLEVSRSITDAAKNIQTMITLTSVSAMDTSGSTRVAQEEIQQDRDMYNMALQDLTASHAAVRGEAISIISRLAEQRSPVVDPTATSHLLLGAPLRDKDEYVYLAAIKALDVLAQHHPTSTIPTMLDAYADRLEHRTLDERLRIGEALSRILESAAEAQASIDTSAHRKFLRPPEATKILEALTGVAGRRGTRLKEARQRERQNARRNAEARRAWGGEVPQAPEPELPVSRKISEAEARAMERILEEWEGTGAEEDVRIRASALSLIARIFEAHINSPSAIAIQIALDLVHDTLKFEREGVEKAILRRSAIVAVLSLLHGLQSVSDGRNWQGQDDEKTRLAARLESLAQQLKTVQSTDADELARQHATDVLESLENFKLQAAIGTRESDEERMPVLGGRLAGLEVSAPESQALGAKDGRPSIIEEVDDDG